MGDVTYDLDLLRTSRDKWESSPAIRAFYGDVYTQMMTFARPGDTLDLGSGIGSIRDFFPDVITSDIEKTPYVERAASCYAIEETDRSWDNLTATDVLHHLLKPIDFFRSAAASLNPGGRVILTEPAATPGGILFYTLFHHEPIKPGRLNPPFEFEADTGEGEFANMGMGAALFSQHLEECRETLADLGLRIVAIVYRDLLGYPLTGGFSKPQLLPTGIICGLLRLEKKLPQCVHKLLGLRMIIVLEKL